MACAEGASLADRSISCEMCSAAAPATAMLLCQVAPNGSSGLQPSVKLPRAHLGPKSCMQGIGEVHAEYDGRLQILHYVEQGSMLPHCACHAWSLLVHLELTLVCCFRRVAVNPPGAPGGACLHPVRGCSREDHAYVGAPHLQDGPLKGGIAVHALHGMQQLCNQTTGREAILMAVVPTGRVHSGVLCHITHMYAGHSEV